MDGEEPMSIVSSPATHAAPRPILTQADEADSCHLSVIIPIYNEEENIVPLNAELITVLEDHQLDYEVIYVNDGSADGSLDLLVNAAEKNPRIRVVDLRRNFGQTAAMAAGIEHSRGQVLIPMDGDRQNDPHDIPKLLKKLDGPPRYDIVSGWRKDRQDKWLTRRVPSQAANAIICRVTDVPIHDFGCTLKAYRREVLADVSLSSDLHRFLPALAKWHGANIAEMVTNHRPRVAGTTKYGLWRTVRVVLDLITVKFLGTYMTKPLYFFGKVGLVTILLSMLSLAIAVGQRFGFFWQPEPVHLNDNVLVYLSALLAFFTLQCILFGIVAELLVRVYNDTRGRTIYRVRNVYQSRPVEGAEGGGTT
jgi:glycosyltransferase involved in cell wall biosynthesis